MDDQLNQLQAFLEKDKLSDQEWEKRGLNPSSSEVCALMNNTVNSCCQGLIKLVSDQCPSKTLKKELKFGLRSIDKHTLDTEETNS